MIGRSPIDSAPEVGIEDEVAERRVVQFDLVVARPPDATGDGEDARAGGPCADRARRRVAPIAHDPRDGRQRLDVVDDRRLPVETLHRRVRRPHSRHPALTLEARQERALLADDVRAGAAVRDHVAREGGTENVAADQTMTTRVGESIVHPVVGERSFAVHVHEHATGTDRVGTEQRPLEELVWIVLEEHSIFEVPGSDSSPFTTTYAGRSGARLPLCAVVNALPPLRPVKADVWTSASTCSGVMSWSACRSAS